jgi:hypothetical protein
LLSLLLLLFAGELCEMLRKRGLSPEQLAREYENLINQQLFPGDEQRTDAKIKELFGDPPYEFLREERPVPHYKNFVPHYEDETGRQYARLHSYNEGEEERESSEEYPVGNSGMIQTFVRIPISITRRTKGKNVEDQVDFPRVGDIIHLRRFQSLKKKQRKTPATLRREFATRSSLDEEDEEAEEEKAKADAKEVHGIGASNSSYSLQMRVMNVPYRFRAAVSEITLQYL